MKNEGSVVRINGKNYTLGQRISGGAEGSVFDVAGLPNYVIKIINSEKLSANQKSDIYNHLRWLKLIGDKKDSDCRQYMALPRGILDDELGYIMVKAGEHDCLKKYLDIPNEDFDNWYLEKYTFKKRCQIISNLFRALREIHLAGLVFTDLSPNNIMVHRKQNQIVFIDTDNTRRRTDPYNGVLGTPGYMAPELYHTVDKKMLEENHIQQRYVSKCGKITPDSDVFSAAVIAFQLLLLQHPFVGDKVDEGSADEETLALEMKTDYIFKAGTSNTSTSGLTKYYEQLTTPRIRELFYRTFVDGKTFPQLRPTDEDFLEAFQNLADLIFECPDCGFSRIYTPNTENECINCGKKYDSCVSMVIYNVFQNIKRDEVINSIGNFPDYNIELGNLLDENGKAPQNYMEISRIVFRAGEPKFLYLRHFESVTDRSEKFARITLSNNLRDISIEVIKSAFSNPKLIEKRNRGLIPLDKGKEFPFDKYGVIFDTKKHGNGIMQIFAKFEMI